MKLSAAPCSSRSPLLRAPTNRLYTPALVARKEDDTLVKVSICAAPPEGATLAELDALPALKWFTETNGKLYFRP